MTSNATTLIKSILASSNAMDRRALLGRLLLPLLAVEDAAKTARLPTQVVLPVSRDDRDGEQACLIDVDYRIAHWNFMADVARAHHKGELSLEVCGFDDGKGTIHDALVALFDQRPVAVVYAVTDREIAVCIGGFERAGVAHDGRLAKLSADAAADGVVTPAGTDERDRRRDTPAGNRARDGRKRRARAEARQAKAAAATVAAIPCSMTRSEKSSAGHRPVSTLSIICCIAVASSAGARSAAMDRHWLAAA